MQIIITPEVEQHLEKIYAYGVSNWGHLRATRFLEDLQDSLAILQTTPEIGTPAELRVGRYAYKDARIWRFRNYRTVFRVVYVVIWIIAIIPPRADIKNYIKISD